MDGNGFLCTWIEADGLPCSMPAYYKALASEHLHGATRTAYCCEEHWMSAVGQYYRVIILTDEETEAERQWMSYWIG